MRIRQENKVLTLYSVINDGLRKVVFVFKYDISKLEKVANHANLISMLRNNPNRSAAISTFFSICLFFFLNNLVSIITRSFFFDLFQVPITLPFWTITG